MLINSESYFQALENIKAQIKGAQYKALLGANREQICLFWNIGRIIIANTKYGSKFIENLARDIKAEFPNVKGFSVRNLQYMRKFAEFVDEEVKVQTVSALLSWSHNSYLLDKASSLEEYLWYATQTIENGWSLSSLEYHVGTKTYERQGLATKSANYNKRLPPPQNSLATETLKDPYVFDFIERDIENELVANIAKTLIELGTGFAFLGNQLKTGKFKPEYAGKLNFYLSAIDDMLKNDHDRPSIGILLCKEKDKLTVEYALRDINKPIGVSEYRLSDFVPQEFVDTLPSAEDIEKRIMNKYEIKEE